MYSLDAVRGKTARLVAHHWHNGLISDLVDMSVTVELASPKLVTTSRKPHLQLLSSRESCGRAASIGGWSRLLPEMAAAYAGNTTHAHKAWASPQTHLAYKYFKLFPDADDSTISLLLSDIRDPRWFIQPNTPDRAASLRKWFGVGGHNVAASLQRSVDNAACRRLNRLIGIWYPGDVEAARFPYMSLRQMGWANESKTVAAGCRKVLAYIFWAWLDELARSRGASEALFVPSQIMTADELILFKQVVVA